MTSPPAGRGPRATIARAVSTDLRVSRRRRALAGGTLLAIVGVCAVGLSACGGSDGADLPEGVVARVGDATITQKQLDRVLEQSKASAVTAGQKWPAKGSADYVAAQRQALQQIVSLDIIQFEAKACGTPCAVTDAAVTAQLADITKNQFQGKQAQLVKYLTQHKISMAEARTQVKAGLQQQKIQSHVTRGVRFTEADAKSYYLGHRSEFVVQPSRTASHILVKTKAEADALYAEATPANFADLAKKNSTDTTTKVNGGSLGQIQKGQLVAEFEKVAFSLPKGKVSAPVKTQFGWHLILITGITPGRTIPFAEAKKGIVTQQLSTKRSEVFQKWVDKTLADWKTRTVYASKDLEPVTTSSTSTAPATTSP